MLRLPNCPRWDHNIGLFSLSTNFGDKFVEHAIQVAKRPLAFTHSNARPLCDNCCDKSDGKMRNNIERAIDMRRLLPRLTIIAQRVLFTVRYGFCRLMIWFGPPSLSARLIAKYPQLKSF